MFIPLQMNNSGAHFYSQDNRLHKLANNHILQDSTLTVVPNILKDECKTARLYATASDLHIFLHHVSKEPYLSAMKNEDGIIAKDGGSKGIRAQVYADTRRDFSFVLLANYDEMPFFKTIEDLAKMLQGESVEIPKELNRQAISLQNEILQHYTGSYSFADFDGLVLSIEVVGDRLIC